MTVLAVLYGIAAAWWLFPVFLFPFLRVELRGAAAVLAIANAAVATGLVALERWAWTGAIVLAAFDLVAIPVGTAIGIFSLIYLHEPEVRATLGRGAPPPDAPIVPPPLLLYPGSGPPLPSPGHGPVSQPTVHDGATVRPPPAAGTCRRCGAPFDPGDAFCGKCGAPAP